MKLNKCLLILAIVHSISLNAAEAAAQADLNLLSAIEGVAFAWDNKEQERKRWTEQLRDNDTTSQEEDFETIFIPRKSKLSLLASHIFDARTVFHVEELVNAGVTGEYIAQQRCLATKVVASQHKQKIMENETWSPIQVATYYAACHAKCLEDYFFILDFLCSRLGLPLNHKTDDMTKNFRTRSTTAYDIIERFGGEETPIKEFFDTYQGLAVIKRGKARDKWIEDIRVREQEEGGFCGIAGLKFNPEIKYQ